MNRPRQPNVRTPIEQILREIHHSGRISRVTGSSNSAVKPWPTRATQDTHLPAAAPRAARNSAPTSIDGSSRFAVIRERYAVRRAKTIAWIKARLRKVTS